MDTRCNWFKKNGR